VCTFPIFPPRNGGGAKGVFKAIFFPLKGPLGGKLPRVKKFPFWGFWGNALQTLGVLVVSVFSPQVFGGGFQMGRSLGATFGGLTPFGAVRVWKIHRKKALKIGNRG